MKFKKVKADEWQQPVKRRYKMVCCDCGLVHWTDFRIHKGRVQFRARRANGLTAKHRKDRKITFTWNPPERKKGLQPKKK